MVDARGVVDEAVHLLKMWFEGPLCSSTVSLSSPSLRVWPRVRKFVCIPGVCSSPWAGEASSLSLSPSSLLLPLLFSTSFWIIQRFFSLRLRVSETWAMIWERYEVGAVSVEMELTAEAVARWLRAFVLAFLVSFLLV